MNQEPGILYISSSSKTTKSKVFLDYIDQELDKQRNIYGSFKKSPHDLDYVSLYPEIEFKDKLVGLYDPNATRIHNILHLFPFHDIVLCVVRVENCASDEKFQSKYGCSIQNFLRLCDIGKIVPLLPDNPYLPSHNYSYFKDLYKRKYPSYKRYYNLFQSKKVNTAFSNEEFRSFYNSLVVDVTKKYGDIASAFEIPEPVAMDLLRISLRPLIRGDIGQAYLFLNYINILLHDKNFKVEKIRNGLDDIDNWFVQSYIAHGAVLNFSSDISESFRETTKNKVEFTKQLLEQVFGNNSKAIKRLLAYSEQMPIFSDDLLVLLNNSFFYEPPEAYKDPVEYVYAIDKSDNVKENLLISKQLHKYLAKGDFKKVHNILSDKDYRIITKELNKEINSLEKAAKRNQILIEFGATVIGAVTGVALGNVLTKGDLSLVFSYLGTHAASALTKDHSASLSQKVTIPLFRRNNPAYLIWKRRLDQTNE